MLIRWCHSADPSLCAEKWSCVKQPSICLLPLSTFPYFQTSKTSFTSLLTHPCLVPPISSPSRRSFLSSLPLTMSLDTARTRELFLRCMSAIFLVAFLSLYLQIRGEGRWPRISTNLQEKMIALLLMCCHKNGHAFINWHWDVMLGNVIIIYDFCIACPDRCSSVLVYNNLSLEYQLFCCSFFGRYRTRFLDWFGAQ